METPVPPEAPFAAEALFALASGRRISAFPFEETRITCSPWPMVVGLGSRVEGVIDTVTGEAPSIGESVTAFEESDVTVPRSRSTVSYPPPACGTTISAWTERAMSASSFDSAPVGFESPLWPDAPEPVPPEVVDPDPELDSEGDGGLAAFGEDDPPEVST